ncbi:MAG TPA: AAA family ATPase [Albitalea sp.]|uniref:ATP-binding protein n=1 Tax=Piscinibacter sp. TaxID=1903157 RepID=UPI002ED21929
MGLLERGAPLAQLNQVWRRMQQRAQGECVLIHGEAGIGKTSLVRAFMRDLAPASTNLLVAGCEALSTPRPLGPLVDLADRLPPAVATALHAGSTWNGLFPAFLGTLRDAPRPTLFVIEDIQWADAATLDFARYVGRRMHDVAMVLLLTYRSDELPADHPLRRVLGEFPAATTTRIALSRLSADAVATLALRSGRSTRGIFEATAGNPFYVTEVLATHGSGVPPSVTDAVLARLARLSPAAREVAERVSLFPNQVGAALLKAIGAMPPEAVDECLEQGLLVTCGDDALAFRHELAREAAYQAILPYRRSSLHAAVFAASRDAVGADESLARQVHHADRAGLADDVVLLAPRAARYDAARGAHRDAARLYALALRHGAALPPACRADLLEARALECTMTGVHGDAIRDRRQALELRRQLGDRRAEGINLRWLARLHGWSDSLAAAFDHAHQSIDVLEALAPDRELAMSYSTLSHLNLVGERMTEVQTWGLKAIELADRLNDAAALSQALNTVGTARLRFEDDQAAWSMLERSLQLALDHGLDAEAALAHTNLHVMALVHRHFARAVQHADRGIAFCEARGIDVFTTRMRIRRAFAHVQTGDWQLADADLAEVRERHTPSAMEQVTRDFVQGLLDLRRGTRDAPQRLAQTVAAMQRLGVRMWFTSTAAACSEAAWLCGDADAVRAAAAPALEHALSIGDAWRAGELATWLVRSGAAPRELPASLIGPYALEAVGRAHDGADAWARLGCPYEQALALSCSGEAGMREALQRFERLGATPAAEVMRRRLRALGARGVQRGPQSRTRIDPLGLTARERQVFDLLRQGLSNVGIAARMHRSERTVEHHVASVFAKVGVNSRAELMAAFDLVPQAAEV